MGEHSSALTVISHSGVASGMQDRAVTQAPEQTGLGMELSALPAAVQNSVITLSLNLCFAP